MSFVRAQVGLPTVPPLLALQELPPIEPLQEAGVIIVCIALCVGFGLAIKPAIIHDRNLK